MEDAGELEEGTALDSDGYIRSTRSSAHTTTLTSEDVLLMSKNSTREATPDPLHGSLITSFAGLPAISFQSYRIEQAKRPPVYWRNENLPHSLEDHINALPVSIRFVRTMRQVFEAAIMEYTMEDEPQAPPIQVINNVDSEPTPEWEFHYSNRLYLGKNVPPPDVENLVGCDCIGPCNPKSTTCACIKKQMHIVQRTDLKDEWTDFVYDAKRRLKPFASGVPIFECNRNCSCDDDCRNRVVQQGRTVPVDIAKTPDKGWG